MDIHMLEMYRQVCEEASISRAADRLYLSRQALTETMNKLEKEMGVTLLKRTHSGVTLTNAGRYLFVKSGDFIQEWRSISKSIRDIESREDMIKFGAALGTLQDDTVSRLYDLGRVRGMPFLILDRTTTNCNRLLKSGKLDIAYAFDNRDDVNLDYFTVNGPFAGSYFLMASTHPLVRETILSKETLAGHTLLLPDDESRCNQIIEEYANSAGMRITTVPCIHGVQADLISQGWGVLCIPGSSISQFVTRDDFIAKPVADFPHVMRQHITFCKGRYEELKEACEILVEFFEDVQCSDELVVDEDGTVRWEG